MTGRMALEGSLPNLLAEHDHQSSPYSLTTCVVSLSTAVATVIVDLQRTYYYTSKLIAPVRPEG